MNYLKKTVLVFAMIFPVLICSCKEKSAYKVENKTKGSEKKVLIGFSIDSFAIERWKREVDVFINEAKNWDAEVIVQNAANDVTTQLHQLDYLASKNVDVVVILPKQGDAFGEAVQKLRNKGIPVISYDRLILNANISLYLTVDSEKVGYLAGEEMLKRTNSKHWFRMMGPLDDYNVHLFMCGLNEAVSSKGIVFDYTYYTPDWNYDFSRNRMKEILLSGTYPDVIICGNDSVANSVISAYKEYASGKKYNICGQDCDIVACQNIVNGFQDFSIFKPIEKLAQEAARYAVLIASDP